MARPCDPLVQCRNMDPGYMCEACPPGYSGNTVSGVGLEEAVRKRQTCIDIDECVDPNICPPHTTCQNTEVSILLNFFKPLDLIKNTSIMVQIDPESVIC